jgi:hypothetical protein
MRNLPGLTTDVTSPASSHAPTPSRRRPRGARGGRRRHRAEGTIAPAKVVDGVATLRLYDYIDGDGGYWGISANEFAEALDAIEDDVTGSSCGSTPAAARCGTASPSSTPCAATTPRHRGRRRHRRLGRLVHRRGVRRGRDDAQLRMMIHDALGICIGQAADMREYADFLDDSSDNIAEIYATKAGGTTADWRATMTAKGLLGQWYTAQEAVDAGLADKVGGQTEDQPDDKAPKAAAPAERPTPRRTSTPPGSWPDAPPRPRCARRQPA